MKRLTSLVVLACAGLMVWPLGCGSAADVSGPGSSGAGGAGNTTAPGGGGGVGGAGGGDECSTEVCDGLDNDCDSEVDEGCLCVDGDTQGCFSGDPNLLGVGECAEGTQTCDLSGSWGPCVDEVLPADEECDGADNNCDGAVDEGFASVTCGLGICQVTVDECVNGVPNPCIPGNPAPSETCDGTDDNCDGQVDEGCSCVNEAQQSCYTGAPNTQNVGECTDGLQTCGGGVWGPCVGDITPTAEQCDGLDNDCDAQTDENDPGGGGNCQTGQQGVCAAGTMHCTNGNLGCNQNVQPSTEQCNGLDDNCDGSTDEGNPGGGGACNTGLLGVCMAGIFDCLNGQVQCTQTVQPSAEQCNGLDDDCDGGTDEGNPDGGGACNTGNAGICAAGIDQCQNGGIQCQQINQPTGETCNGLDDDCDGATDEGNPGGGNACNTGNPGICAAGIDQCINGGIVCQQTNQPTSETCNGLDDDCDNQTDEGDPGGGGVCNTGNPGICAAGIYQCLNGSLSCQQTTQATSETCNGLDDDCDTQIDEGNPGGGGGCNTGIPGICAAGIYQCQNGSLNCQQTTPATNEMCNGLDDDCDGSTDEGNPGGGGSCNTGNLGICAAGTYQCINGGIQCQQINSPIAEVCGNNLDDDCDGQTDEGCGTCNNFAPTTTPAVNPNGGSVPPYAPASMINGIGQNCLQFGWMKNSSTVAGWASLTWSGAQLVGSMFIDGEHGTAPDCGPNGRNIATATVQYRNTSNVWVTVGTISGAENYMYTFPSQVLATGVRLLNVYSSTGNGNSMVHEWYLYSGTGCPTPTPN